MFMVVGQRLHARSLALLGTIENRLPRLVFWWTVTALIASAARIALSPTLGRAPDLGTVMPYVLLVAAPVASLALAMRWFADSDRMAQPSTRLAVVGRWRSVSRAEQHRHPLFGTSGFMVSLLVGMLLNVPIRALEYLAAVPAMTAAAPLWARTIHTMMTLDVVLLSSLYVIAFVAALRRVPLFPRLLAAIWCVDILMQLVIAQAVAGAPGLPLTVAGPLETILRNNVQKVLISVALWLPYLLLSTRVNVTYRSRLPA